VLGNKALGNWIEKVVLITECQITEVLLLLLLFSFTVLSTEGLTATFAAAFGLS